MYCRSCGKQVNSNSEVCPSCGVRPLNDSQYCQSCGSETKPQQEICTSCGVKLIGKTNSNDKPSTIANIGSFCFPIVGLILYLVWKQDKPIAAKSACNWTLIGIGVSIAIYLVAMFLGALSYI